MDADGAGVLGPGQTSECQHESLSLLIWRFYQSGVMEGRL